ncbi:MAG: zinc ABC transporter substrate-binding protein [Cyclobacteriaceae bacterium]
MINKLLLTSFLFGMFLSCSTPEKSESGKLNVVATTGMLYDAVLNIGGDKVEAQAIMGPGVDPHLYKATQGDLAKFNQADVIIYNGILLEGKMTEVLGKLGRQKPVFAVAESIPVGMLLPFAGYKDAFDPHVWFDVSRWKHVVQEIGNSLSNADSVNTGYYKENTQVYLKKLDSLDLFVQTRIQEIPENRRILVTAHDAFGYFGDAYGVQVEGLQGISTVADFGLKDIANIIDIIISNDINAIFVETSVSEKSINAVVTGCREKGHEVSIGGYLYSDAMGEFGTIEGTYLGMFKKNVNTIVDALK